MKRVFEDGKFLTSDGRAQFIAIEDIFLPAKISATFPLLLNTGRVRDHWHTMTRTGKSPRLSGHTEEPFIEIHPDDAETYALADGGFARVATSFGQAVLRVRYAPGQRAGEIFAPIHWNGEWASHGRIGALVQSACDPHSGQPELKATPATVSPVTFATEGFLLVRDPKAMPPASWWSRIATKGGVGYRLACNVESEQWPDLARELLGSALPLVELSDAAQGRYRAAVIREGRLEGCLFLARHCDALPNWEWLKHQLAGSALSDSARRALLAGHAPNGEPNQGPIICACFGVGRNSICDFITKGKASSAEGIGRSLKAGTNCGTCIPEIRRLFASVGKEGVHVRVS